MPVQISQLADIAATTLKFLNRPNYTELARDLRRFTAFKQIFNQNRVVLDGGSGIQWDVMVAGSNSAQNNGLGALDSLDISDGMVQASADWRNSSASYAVEGREIAVNAGSSRIVDLFRTRRARCMIGLAELMENNWWGPPVALSDSITPWGVNTWIVKNASEGFNGGAPSGYTSIGLNPTTYPRWKNWTAQYTSVTKDDLIRKVRKAFEYTNFEPPIEESMPTTNTGDDMKLYSNYALVAGLEEVLESQNDNLGTDVASMDGKVVIRGRPILVVPKLDADTTNPLYGINWGDVKTYVLKGWWLRETNVPIYPGQHTISAHFLDSTYQPVFLNRRTSFVIATGTTYPS